MRIFYVPRDFSPLWVFLFQAGSRTLTSSGLGIQYTPSLTTGQAGFYLEARVIRVFKATCLKAFFNRRKRLVKCLMGKGDQFIDLLMSHNERR
jgi:hypothetical protein